MATVRRVDDILDDLKGALENGGGTIPVLVGQRVPAFGYAVGQPRYGASGPAGTLDIRGWLTAVLPTVAFTPDLYLGAWVEKGVMHLDVVYVHVPALADARKGGEIANWLRPPRARERRRSTPPA